MSANASTSFSRVYLLGSGLAYLFL